MRETPNVRINVGNDREGYRAVNATTCNDCSAQRRCRGLRYRYHVVIKSSAYMREEIDRWAAVIKSANIELQ
ncbi:hypothetical protein [Bradyrhizobium sp. sGM-13]|uniref:hypothetical protein n=1 Tax=Bradyrhizobium sp. sGM-13 TaxID=2831781 RepID=UPI001BD122B6|nr:hypothetical protein [Bradyrhizobium sp. sGM-13]